MLKINLLVWYEFVCVQISLLECMFGLFVDECVWFDDYCGFICIVIFVLMGDFMIEFNLVSVVYELEVDFLVEIVDGGMG